MFVLKPLENMNGSWKKNRNLSVWNI